MGKDLNGKELGIGISQRKNGIYQARYVDRFGNRKTIYDKNLRELKNKLNSSIYEDKKKLNVVDEGTTLDEWYNKWIDIHKYNAIRINNLFVVAVNTGLRPGEICALRWDDIDLDRKEISVERTLLYQKLEEDEQKEFHFDPPKTKTSKRKVPINSQILIDAIKKIVDEINLMRDDLEQMEAFSAHTF